MRVSTLAYLLSPVGVIARPCGGSHATRTVTVYPSATYPAGTAPGQSTVVSATTGPLPSSAVSESSSSAAASSSNTASAATSVTTPATTSSTAGSSSGTSAASASASATSTSTSASATSTSTSASATSTAIPDSDSIDTLFKAHGKLYFGTAADSGTLSISANSALIDADFGQLTPENSMKWDAIHPSLDTYSFTGSDALVDYATAHDKSLRGHTLLWYQQLPSYVEAITAADELQALIEDHVATVVGRYAGQIRSWDVVNEIFTEAGELRDCVFTQVLGEDFVRIAFEAARKADPAAKLYISDFHLESSSSAKVEGALSYVNKWVAAGVPIDGVGLQGHLGGSNPGAEDMVAGLEKMSETGLELAITELDIVGAAAEDYVKVVQGCLDVEACVGITTWGVSDKDSWLSEKTPLLFDTNYEPKPAYDAVVELLSS
ncbi:glycoside hydrolase family 10 protein [Xylariaceae sp. FL0016]|nr:glycoside hydrolase family 10 protein [Xylariaceae sp. FL0016]